ncbi:MAG TPA: RluA family pseudouridine synthase [Pirellulaceae bacterium]|nr:RluA family pseudouridine synthase [Pirellulaceae bacterium]
MVTPSAQPPSGQSASRKLQSAIDLSAEPLELIVPPADAGLRLDAFLARSLPKYSRVQLRKVIGSGGVTVNEQGTKVAYKLSAGDRVRVVLPSMNTAGPHPENIPLDILYEDEHIIAVNKPPGMVVHPARGHWSGTLASALSFHFQQLSKAGGPTRPGIVHRLDRDTSGVMVVAKTDPMHYVLAAQFEARTTEKEYLAITAGVPDRDRDIIQQPIGIHPHQREKMAIRAGHSTSRDASTFYEVVERFPGYALVRVLPKTGRTHQIRVHLAHIGCPVLCDKLYGGRSQITRGEVQQYGTAGGARSLAANATDVVLSRQALHARRIKLSHPATKEPIEFVAPLPGDLSVVLSTLRSA